MSRGIRKNITIPGALAPALRLRSRECGFRTLSPFVVDLVIYDLQRGAPHTITVTIARDTQSAQDAVDAELVAHYRPGLPRDEALLVQLVQRLTEVRLLAKDVEPSVPLSATPLRVTFPARIWAMVDARWEEVGYDCLSGYVTGLVRYNLMIAGPHRKVMPSGRRSARDAVTRETIARRKRGERRKPLIDHLIERTEGRPLNDSELERIKTEIARTFCASVLESS